MTLFAGAFGLACRTSANDKPKADPKHIFSAVRRFGFVNAVILSFEVKTIINIPSL